MIYLHVGKGGGGMYVCVCAREREKTKREVRRQRGSLFVFLRVESIEADFLFQASSE